MGPVNSLIGTVARIAAATAFVAMIALASAPSEAYAAACALSIATCGCTITAPGTYKLTGTSILSTGTCIDIAASHVTLDGRLVELSGPGIASATFGVYVEPAANKSFLENIVATNFGVGIGMDGRNAFLYQTYTEGDKKGIVINGANAYLLEVSSTFNQGVGIQVNAAAEGFQMNLGEARDNTGAGIKLNGVKGAFLDGPDVSFNGTFGIWLQSASMNVIDGFDAEDNGLAGVYLGCNPTGPNSTACPPGVPSSNGNSIQGSLYGNVVGVVSNGGSQHFGVAVGLGNQGNRFIGIEGSGNLNEDALDENPNCGNNRWLSDLFTSTSPPPNTTFFCLN